MPARWPRPLTPNRRRALACEIEEELRTHLALRADDNRRAGMDPTEAEADALARFGDVEHIAAACLWAEQTHPLREVQRLVVTGLVFAVGFGAFAAAFSLAFAVLRPPAPLRRCRPARPVRGRLGGRARPARALRRRGRRRATSFERFTAFNAMDFALGGGVARRAGYRPCSSVRTTSACSASRPSWAAPSARWARGDPDQRRTLGAAVSAEPLGARRDARPQRGAAHHRRRDAGGGPALAPRRSVASAPGVVAGR